MPARVSSQLNSISLLLLVPSLSLLSFETKVGRGDHRGRERERERIDTDQETYVMQGMDLNICAGSCNAISYSLATYMHV